MVETKQNFDSRLRSLTRKHRRMSNGYTAHMRRDGLIVVKPKRGRMQFPLKGAVLVAIGFFAFKAFMLMSLGEVTYADRLADLQNGTLIEQGGAWVMQADPLTQAMVNFANTNLL
ncbi:hypothetical protein JQX09_06310 [Sulfitobacter pseudonitzschiae]|uniref:Uncharacterized protein n=2 Tax=Pseudosulfitobacter pseudonitzschiae TaxID=1402135 RepID=A0A9Q2P074_9RHOB|nr:hypothetical protein [Pseudosulfitobacter pseudonitzschiae]MBM2296431.1 hypothetical protein [Pseudosulfitobacter pseudonitzschiae]MBM2301344.1 hypothetical protein [Pseudosulfitobacter pseudonitzschiae]MBM2311128.1 hypothetical protein [Pseudosulfitobacter pseudonitzschiae]MBM2316041.1 hypothetical protein [Pseudosulfitobacter pseudonitzschiae]|tara:strand:- start:352 stop:696 length:345 start_codon:yes stop_codon:yes gene_type:complete